MIIVTLRLVSNSSFRVGVCKNIMCVIENLGAAEIELTPNDLGEIESAFSKTTVQGARLSEEHMILIDR